MTTKEAITGICINCNNKESCSYLTSIKGPVVCCEEYDIFEPQKQNINVLIKNNPGEIHTTSSNNYSSGIKGLCMNCEHNSECKSASLPGGIWHCEEYR